VPPPRRALTTGCGGGTTFVDVAGAFAPVQADLQVTPTQVLALMKRLQENATLYQASGGVHASGLASGDELLVTAEDVGRHNTLDKIRGECLLGGLSPRGKILLTTGRVSSEMLIKAVRMDVPVLISHSSPTDLAVQLARALQVTLIGYARGNRFDVYAGEERVQPDRPSGACSAAALRVAEPVDA
jgi:FdhD protein